MKVNSRILQILSFDESGSQIISIDEFYNNFEPHVAIGCQERKKMECLAGPAAPVPQHIDEDPLVAAPRLTHKYTGLFWALWGLIVSGEEEAMQRHMTDNVVLRAPWIESNLSGERKGRANVAKYFREFFASFDRFPFPQGVAVRSTGISAAAISPVMVTGRIEARVVQTGRILKTPFVAFFHIESNKVNMIEMWHDIEHWSAAFSCQLGEAFGCATAEMYDPTKTKGSIKPAPEANPGAPKAKPKSNPPVTTQKPPVPAPVQPTPNPKPAPVPRLAPKPKPRADPGLEEENPSDPPPPGAGLQEEEESEPPKPKPKPKPKLKPQPKEQTNPRPKTQPKPEPKQTPSPDPDSLEEQPSDDALPEEKGDLPEENLNGDVATEEEAGLK